MTGATVKNNKDKMDAIVKRRDLKDDMNTDEEGSKIRSEKKLFPCLKFLLGRFKGGGEVGWSG